MKQEILTLADLVLLIKGGEVRRAGVALIMTPYETLPSAPEDQKRLLKDLEILVRAFRTEHYRLQQILSPQHSNA